MVDVRGRAVDVTHRQRPSVMASDGGLQTGRVGCGGTMVGAPNRSKAERTGRTDRTHVS